MTVIWAESQKRADPFGATDWFLRHPRIVATPAKSGAFGESHSEPLTTERLRSVGLNAGLAAVGVTPVEILEPARTVLKLRKQRGLAGAMQFTYRNPERSTDPSLLVENAQSLIAGAYRYPHQHSTRSSDTDAEPAVRLAGRVARYATRDYYAELERGLEAIAEQLRAHGFSARVVADQNGLVDRNVAWSAGIGSYGKNANLLLPDAGSWFVLGAVVTNAKLATTGPPVSDQCGPCTRCIDECPTGAILAPGVVDATRCIAWLVQSDGPLPLEFREAIGDRLYGCDECQEVCPPNRGVGSNAIRTGGIESSGEPTEADDPQLDSSAFVDLFWILSATDDEILQRHGRWYIARRDVANIRRTALVVLGNVASPDCVDSARQVVALLTRYLDDPNPVLRSHAVWSARRLGLDRLLSAPSAERDPTVLPEYSADINPRFTAVEWNAVEWSAVEWSAVELDASDRPSVERTTG